MRSGLCLWCLCTVVSTAQVSARINVSFFDTDEGDYLKSSGGAHSDLSGEVLSAAVTALLNVAPISDVDSKTSQQVASIVKASPFNKPEALGVFTIAGSPDGADFLNIQIAQSFESAGAQGVLPALVGLASAEGVEHTVLDVSSLAGCRESCVEALLIEALEHLAVDANYTQGTENLKGKLSIRLSGSRQVSILDLQDLADRLFAVEVASMWRTAKDAAEERQRRRMQGSAQAYKPQLLERTLVSLQAVKVAHGGDSTQYQVALAILQKLLQAAVHELQQAYKDRIAFVLITVNNSELPSTGIAEILQWKESAQLDRPLRSLLAATPSNQDAYVESFIAWIAMWSTFFVLVFFALSGCHCLRKMKFKQDSLLYGKNKAD